MVAVVSSRARSAKSHFTCQYTGCAPPAGNVSRETLAALLTAVWGVPDTATYFRRVWGEM
eukprot:309261-Chlamydomonas_euryale.AAC.1